MPFFSSAQGSRTWLLLALPALLAGLGCARSEGNKASTDEGMSLGGSPPADEVDSVSFLQPDPLLLSPRESRSIAVRVEPPGFRRVSFTLVAESDGSDFDGYLESAETLTDEAGIATIELTAPSRPGLFFVRASAGSLHAERTVSVGEQGFASLLVVPTYSGSRAVTSWTALAHLDKSCEDLASPWIEGDLLATSAKEVRLNDLPVVERVAVVARAGKFISGCTTVEKLVGNETRKVTLPVSDRPLQLVGNSVPVILDIEERAAPFVQVLEQAAELGANSVTEQPVGLRLLRQMREELPTGEAQDGMDAWLESDEPSLLLTSHFSSAVAPRDAIFQMLMNAAAKVDGPDAFVFSLQFDEESHHLELDTAVGVAAKRSGFLGSSTVSLEVQPGDVLVVGGDLKFEATQFLYAIADQATFREEGTEVDLTAEQALTKSIRCDTLASTLAAGIELDECDEACLELACQEAMTSLWHEAGAAGDALTTVRVGITATARVDAEARPVELYGTWIGSLDAEEPSIAGTVGLPPQMPPESR